MQFALNQTGFPSDELETNLEIIAASGYDGIEPNFSPEGVLKNPQSTGLFADLVADYDLEVPSISTTIHWEYPLTSTDKTTQEQGMAFARRMLSAADEVDADTILLVPGVLDADMQYDDCYENALRSIQILAEEAPTGVTIGVENVSNNLLLSPREFVEFIDRAKKKGSVSAYFDVGNVIYYGQYPQHWIRMLNDRITKLHVKGFNKSGTTYPLQGDIDWNEVTAAIADIGYDGWVTAEVPPYRYAPKITPRHILESLRAGLHQT
jgi:L-ribulose-5-phosphate 3-epimerase